ncbi:hypothetical protein, partial [Ensifer sp. Root231]|uniref:hypothetical protein n=1 Tax=unclassified Ensifer TaxID=2633371 RepID=UPI0032999777
RYEGHGLRRCLRAVVKTKRRMGKGVVGKHAGGLERFRFGRSHRKLYLLVFTHFLTENCFALFLEML